MPTRWSPTVLPDVGYQGDPGAVIAEAFLMRERQKREDAEMARRDREDARRQLQFDLAMAQAGVRPREAVATEARGTRAGAEIAPHPFGENQPPEPTGFGLPPLAAPQRPFSPGRHAAAGAFLPQPGVPREMQLQPLGDEHVYDPMAGPRREAMTQDILEGPRRSRLAAAVGSYIEGRPEMESMRGLLEERPELIGQLPDFERPSYPPLSVEDRLRMIEAQNAGRLAVADRRARLAGRGMAGSQYQRTQVGLLRGKLASIGQQMAVAQRDIPTNPLDLRLVMRTPEGAARVEAARQRIAELEADLVVTQQQFEDLLSELEYGNPDLPPPGAEGGRETINTQEEYDYLISTGMTPAQISQRYNVAPGIKPPARR